MHSGNFIVVEITPIGISSLGWKFYIIWTVFNGAFVPLVYLFYPETAGRTLEDIDRYFMEHDNIFVFKDKVILLTSRRYSAADIYHRSRHPRNVLRNTLRTKRTRCAVTAVSMRELLRWRWRGMEIACRLTNKARTSIPKIRRRIRKKCDHRRAMMCIVALLA
jgi:hypothetical protein